MAFELHSKRIGVHATAQRSTEKDQKIHTVLSKSNAVILVSCHYPRARSGHLEQATFELKQRHPSPQTLQPLPPSGWYVHFQWCDLREQPQMSSCNRHCFHLKLRFMLTNIGHL